MKQLEPHLENLFARIGLSGRRTTRFIEFLGVGASGAVLDLAVTIAAVGHTHYLIANGLGFLLAVSWNFAGNWWLTFDKPSGSIVWQYSSYVALHAGTFGIRAVVIAVLVESTPTPTVVATVVGIGAAAIANYVASERIFDGVDRLWLDAVGALNQVAHLCYHSRLRHGLRRVGLYSPIYRLYQIALATIYRSDRHTISAGGATADVLVERPAELASVMHTLEKEDGIVERFVADIGADDCIWDVGANLGVFSVLAADIGEEVVAFEPVLKTAERCHQNLALNGGEGMALAVALSNKRGHAELALERDEVGTQTATLADGEIKARATKQVPVRQGDELVADGLPAPDVLKIDVEGAEVAVLDGLETALRESVEQVLVETHGDGEPVRERLADAGFDVERVSNGTQHYYRGERHA